MPAPQHKSDIVTSVPTAVLTISDTRTPETDKSGALIRESLESAGHPVVHYAILKDDPPAIAAELDRLIADPEVRAILLTGGTGLSPRDTTYEVVSRRLDKRLDGFGELFRSLSYVEIGPAAMLSRALAGISAPDSACASKPDRAATAIFSMPGATNAVKLAMQKLILPELPHITRLITLS
jgi:molybdenum cofactor biosynthesis protein B